MKRKRRRYYTEDGEVLELGAFHFVVVKQDGTRERVSFAGRDSDEAARHAIRWAHARGYKIYRKRRQ